MHINEVLDTTITESQVTTEVNNDSESSNNVNDQHDAPAAEAQTPSEQPLTESVEDSGTPVTEAATEETPSEETPAAEEPAQEENPAEVPVTESSDSDLLNRVIALTEQLAACTEELRTERNLRESLENSLSEVRSQYKIMLASAVNTLRSQLGKPLMESEELVKRSESSLKDSIADYTSELELQESEEQHTEAEQEETPASTVSLTEGLQEVENPAQVISEEPKQEKQPQTINVAEQFYNLDKILFPR